MLVHIFIFYYQLYCTELFYSNFNNEIKLISEPYLHRVLVFASTLHGSTSIRIVDFQIDSIKKVGFQVNFKK